MKRSLTVFLCSTYSDLVDERNAIIDAITRLKLQHNSMELFGARPNQPLETCLEEVRRSDIMVVVVGHRYGSFVPNRGVSYSEAEYTEGYRLGKICLVYLRDENVPILPKHVERDPNGLRALEEFKKVLQERHTIAQFQNAHDISLQVTTDLVTTIEAIESTYTAEEEPRKRTEAQGLDEIGELWKRAVDLGIPEGVLLSAIQRAVSSLLAVGSPRPPSVFLSYSHKDKDIIRAFADGLRREGFDVWFDEDRIALGTSLINQISKGLDSADFLAFFISEDSTQSKWALQELKMMMARRLTSKSGAIILPILLEDTPIPAFLRDVKYLDLRDGDVERGVKKASEVIVTQRDKDHYLREAFQVVKEYFEAGARETNLRYPEVEIEVDDVHKHKFVCSIHRKGEIVCRCKIWLGGLGSSDGISYLAGENIDLNDDNSVNDWLIVDDSGSELGLRPSMRQFGFSHGRAFDGVLSARKAAEYLWLRAMEPLQHVLKKGSGLEV